MKTKYIVIRTEGGEELLFMFPPAVNHRIMFESVRGLKDSSGQNWSRPYFRAECVGAGFIHGGHCYGESESLGISSRGDVDTALLPHVE